MQPSVDLWLLHTCYLPYQDFHATDMPETSLIFKPSPPRSSSLSLSLSLLIPQLIQFPSLSDSLQDPALIVSVFSQIFPVSFHYYTYIYFSFSTQTHSLNHLFFLSLQDGWNPKMPDSSSKSIQASNPASYFDQLVQRHKMRHLYHTSKDIMISFFSGRQQQPPSMLYLV